MTGSTNNLFSDWHAERRRVRKLNVKLEALVDTTFLDRVIFAEKHLTVSQYSDLAKSRGLVCLI